MNEQSVDAKNVKELLKFMKDQKITDQYKAANMLCIVGGYKGMIARIKLQDKKLLDELISGVSEIQNEIWAKSMSSIKSHYCGADDRASLYRGYHREKAYF